MNDLKKPSPPALWLRFTKMHGLGNDFMVVDGISQSVRLQSEQIRRLADRHFGIGFDQLLVVEPPGQPDVDFRYRIFNADGGEVEQCGNGARCFARFVRDQGLTNKRVVRVETRTGIIELRITREGRVVVNMGPPRLLPSEIPFIVAPSAELIADPAITYPVEVDGQRLALGLVNMGNPHGVLVVENVGTAPVARLGPLLESHAQFPARANIGFMQITGRDSIRLRVFERGSGETLACGTGACAAVVAGQRQGLLDQRVTVRLPGGELIIEWQGEGSPVMMEGPASRVFDGEVRLPGERPRRTVERTAKGSVRQGR